MLSAVLVVMIGVGAYVYFVSTTRALQQAENFQSRRMQVARVGDEDVLRFFYATHRVPGADDLPPEERFGCNRGGRLHFGSFDTEITPTLGLGMWVNADPPSHRLRYRLLIPDGKI